MPSTFSPNLRIELIGNGEQAGNWGSTTNTNLGTLIEQAISGYVTVSVTTASQAFTYADGVSDQARNAMIELTTTTGAAFSVYAPPSPKAYIIYNASAHAATLYNSTVAGNTTAAGTGVVIPAGKTLTMFTDGTDFKGVATSEFLGVLAAANGGTGLSAPGTSGNVLTSDGTGWTSAPIPTPPTPETIPAGSVFYFAANTAPAGYLKANGAAVSRTTYAALFAVTGTTFGVGDGSTTFNLPDLRGEFIRGWADDRSVDTGRVFGSAQADAFKSHNHGLIMRNEGNPGDAGEPRAGTGNVSSKTTNNAILNTGGTETRPRNVALLACIKT